MSVPSGGHILLIVPPFQTSARPALGVSQLKAILEGQGFPTRVLYLNFLFSERIGLDLHEWIFADTFNALLGEFIFSDVLFGHSDEAIEQYVECVLAGSKCGDHLTQLYPRESLSEVLRRVMQQASTFCRHDAMEEIFAHDPWMVGLTSSFQQTCSSLALIREVKRRRPEVLTAMGGANCQTEMGGELLQRFSEIDYVGQGECDHSFVNLVRSLRDGNDAPDIPGILSRGNGQRPVAAEPLRSEELDRLPYPDFSDYFTQLATHSFAHRVAPGLMMETSRGCWWGAKQHCTFCGFNSEEMGFRSKSPSRAMGEMRSLVDQYGVRHISMTDNILDMRYFKVFLPKLAEDPIAELFYETKANLSRAQVRLLARSKVRWINPGIESLSDRTLRLMRKGTTRIQNVQLLKWCAEYGVWVGWNYLYGFPGEREEELAEIAREVEALHHLRPPGRALSIRVDRSSPYFEAPGRYGVEPIFPAEPYRHIYPFPSESLKRMAYVYQSEFFASASKSDAFRALQGIVADWQEAYARSYLLGIRRKKSLNIIDTRRCARRFWHRLVGLRREVYEFCDEGRALPEIRRALGSASDGELQSILDSFVRARLMLHANGQYLSLAVGARGNCGKVAHVATGGFCRPAQESGRLRKNLLHLVTFRMPPGKIVRGVVRRASAALRSAKTKARSRAVFHLTNFLSERKST